MAHTHSIAARLTALAAALLIGGCTAPEPKLVEGVGRGQAASTASALPARNQAPCAPKEAIVFSCELEGNGDQIALCSGGDANPEVLYFARTGGRSPPIVYPTDRRGAGRFMATRVFSTGATGVRTYSFGEPDSRQLIYSISGTGIERQGFFTAPPNWTRAEREDLCRKGTVRDPDWELAERWTRDPMIEKHGLPRP
ncbi:MAG: hypothetical protein ACOY37_03195 [Pseudomonadota bacterium]